MARPPAGGIRERVTRDGHTTFVARFTAYGHRTEQRLGSTAEGWTRSKAEQELTYILADIRRGTWTPGEKPAEKPVEEPAPTFHEFASQWFASREREWKPSTARSYRYLLENHLLPFFAAEPVDQISVRRVDEYREAKLAQQKISPRYLNRTIATLGAILDVAEEYELIDRNPVRINPRNRRVKNVPKPPKIYLDRACQIEALLDAAATLDRRARADRRALSRHLLIATLIFGGLRISEALNLRWADVDLPAGRLRVGGTKTDAAVREFRMKPALAEAMRAAKATVRATGPDDFVFQTATGGRQDGCNTRRRVLVPAVKLANKRLTAEGHPPIPVGNGRGRSLDQHGLRHTHISLRIAVGDDIATVARDVGHADPSVTYKIYTHVMGLDLGERSELAALLAGVEGDATESQRLRIDGSRAPRLACRSCESSP